MHFAPKIPNEVEVEKEREGTTVEATTVTGVETWGALDKTVLKDVKAVLFQASVKLESRDRRRGTLPVVPRREQ